MTWVENKPQANDPLREIADLLRSQKSEISVGVGKHFFWTESSGASAGEPRLSLGSNGPGSARAFYGAQSALSAQPSGKLFVTSDTSRLYGLTSSATTMLLGSAQAIISGGTSEATLPNNTRWHVESGRTGPLTIGTTLYNQNFTTPYAAAAPLVHAQAGSNNPSVTTDVLMVSVLSANSSGFSYQLARIGVNANNSAFVYWRSTGTVAL